MEIDLYIPEASRGSTPEVEGGRRALLLDLHLDHILDLEVGLGRPYAISHLALVMSIVHSVEGI